MYKLTCYCLLNRTVSDYLKLIPRIYFVKINIKHISHQYQTYNQMQKIWEKLRKFRKSCYHKRNIKGIYTNSSCSALRLTITDFNT